jgi:hypothetical protein
MGRNWVDWHTAYDEPGSPLHSRLALVQQRIREALDARPPGPIRVISMCAGQGRDLFGVLADHPRRADVVAHLVELDPRNVELAQRAAAAGLNVTVVAGDAGLSTAYQEAAPTDIALVCGVFGNISEDDIRHTVGWLPRLCREGAIVIWTRHRRVPDLTPALREWFTRAGFTEVAFDTADSLSVGVCTHRFTGRPLPFEPDVRLFAFVSDKV